MLNLIFQRAKANDPSKVKVDCRFFFSENKKEEWFQAPYVKEVLKDIDGAEVIEGCVLRSREGKVMPPEYLSTGSKVAICIWAFPDNIFNITQMGNNALKHVLELSKERDITVLVYREVLYSQLNAVGFTKDYKPVTYDNDIEFYDLFDKWLEEIYND